ncbi:MAG TPA: endodeoxyribonuclease RusA [Pseudomonas sp.]
MTENNMQRLTLPWPPAVLNPNQARKHHWSVRSKAAKAYRAECMLRAKGALLQVPAEGKIRIQLEFCPPDLRERDDDNLIGAFKPGRDGVADALGIDDKRFAMREPLRGAKRPGGAVVMLIEGA